MIFPKYSRPPCVNSPATVGGRGRIAISKIRPFGQKMTTRSGWTRPPRKQEFCLTACKILQMCRQKELILPFDLFFRLTK